MVEISRLLASFFFVKMSCMTRPFSFVDCLNIFLYSEEEPDEVLWGTNFYNSLHNNTQESSFESEAVCDGISTQEYSFSYKNYLINTTQDSSNICIGIFNRSVIQVSSSKYNIGSKYIQRSLVLCVEEGGKCYYSQPWKINTGETNGKRLK